MKQNMAESTEEFKKGQEVFYIPYENGNVEGGMIQASYVLTFGGSDHYVYVIDGMMWHQSVVFLDRTEALKAAILPGGGVQTLKVSFTPNEGHERDLKEGKLDYDYEGLKMKVK